MYPGNHQYYVGQQATANQQHVQGSYLPINQQQSHQGYSAVQNTALQQLQQHQVALQTNNNYAAGQQQVAANAQRRLSKQNSQQLIDQMHLCYNPTQATSQVWMTNGSMPSQQVSEQQQQAQSLSWQHHTDGQPLHSDQQLSSGASVQPGLRDILTAQHVMSPSAISQLPTMNKNVQGSQVANMSILQQQQQSVNRLLHPSVNQPLNSNSPTTWDSNRRLLQSHRLLQSPPQAHVPVVPQQQSISRTNSIPSSHNNLPQAANRMLPARPKDPQSKAMPQHAMTLHKQKIGVPNQTGVGQFDKRDKIHIRFDQTAKQPQPSLVQQSLHPKQTISKISETGNRKISDASTSKDDDEPECDTKSPFQLENHTRIVIDDDIEIVGTKEAEVMSHIRSDCPIHLYVRIERVNAPIDDSNIKRCSKCFCYICDKLALQCEKWLDPSCPHCNANSRSSCWKARRNMKNSQMMNKLTAEELTPEIKSAGALAMEYIILVREEYITYRNGIPCEFHLVPCDCSCHRSNKLATDACAQCKAVHDMKKRFNYDPVRKEILAITHNIQKKYGDQPLSALILFEALLFELCSHRPADFNHMTRTPSNPDPKCQCNTPQIMDEYIEVELIKIFTLHEVPSSFKDKFLSCVNASVQPLQLKDVMKNFMELRHWDDLLLRAVLSGQNVAGRLGRGDTLRETSTIIEMRVNKLTNEGRYLAITRYLKAVKVFRSSSGTPLISDGTPIATAISKWNLKFHSKRGCFRHACIQLAENVQFMLNLPMEFFLEILSNLRGIGLPPKAEILSSFNSSSLKVACYDVTMTDKTVLLLLCLAYIEGSKNAETSFDCHLWLARWLNEEKLSNDPNLARTWMQNSSDLHELSRQASIAHQCTRHLQQCHPMDPQAALFTCSMAVARFLTKSTNNIAYVPDVIKVYKNNEWALYYLFSQPAILGSGSHHMIEWLTGFLKSTGSMMGTFNLDALYLLIAKNSFHDVSAFLRQWIDPNWTSYNVTMIQYVLKVISKFAVRVVNETLLNRNQTVEWLSDVVLEKIIEKKLQMDDNLLPWCEAIGKACCYIAAKNITLYKKVLPTSMWQTSLNHIFTLYQQRFERDLLKQDEAAELLFQAAKHGCPVLVNMIMTHYTDNHVCSEGGSSCLDIMEKVIKVLESPQEEFMMEKIAIVESYRNLSAHETLRWLVCAHCSAKMPKEWTKVWCALEQSGMRTELGKIVEHTLEQFTIWVKELNVQEESDVQRLLRCLDTFVVQVVTTLLQCKFDEKRVEIMISETRYFIANIQLRHDYLGIIHRVFETIKKEREVERKKALPPPTVAKPQVTQHLETRPDTIRNENVHITAAREKKRVVDSAQQRPTNGTAVTNIKQNEKSPSRTEQTKPPAKAGKPSSGLKLTISKSRLISTCGNPTSADSASETSLSSPGLASPSALCLQCGDPMTSSFRCSKCHARKSVEVKCPNCHQINRGLKGYSCRFCYTSLLAILTRGEAATEEETPEPKHEKTHGEKTHDKKTLDEKVRDEKTRDEKTHDEKKPKKLKRKKTEELVLTKDDATNNAPTTFKEKHSTSSEKVPTTCSLVQDISTAKRMKMSLQKDSHEPGNSKDASFSIEPPKHNQKVLNKVPADDFLPQRPKPHQRVKEAQQKERPNPKPITPSKASSNLFSNFETYYPCDSSTSSEEDEGPRHVPPLILKKKKEVTGSSKVKEIKNNRVMESPSSGVSPKRCVSQGTAMSKKQRGILQRMKNIGKVPKVTKISKPIPKPPIERDLTRRRKPGPLSRTSYYVIHSHWDIPKYIKLPYTTDLPNFCVVHLKSFPPDKMNIIRNLQPDLGLRKLYA